MKINTIFALVVGVIILTLLGWALLRPAPMKIDNNLQTNLQLKVKNLSETGELNALYTCDGKSYSPPVEINWVPITVKTLALTVIDPDAPNGQFVHWLVWNLDPASKELLEDNLPIGATAGTGGAGRVGYVGPCPPKGTHHYVFKLLALDTKLTLPVSTTLTEFNAAAAGHIVAAAETVVTYTRQPK
jgi:Raf kinase inhibitor-like YbhB/YbcL family protein